jgi:hypothetical protein
LWPAISGDGRLIAFMAYSYNLVAGDTNNSADIFVHDRVTGVTERVSVDSSGLESNGDSHSPSISADGQFVAFASAASNLASGDTNGKDDVFVHDRSTGSTERISVDSSGGQANGDSVWTSISSDGRLVSFTCVATNLVAADSNGAPDIFVHDRTTGVTVRASVDSSGVQANGASEDSAISGNGQVVAFQSDASNLVVGDTNAKRDVFVHDLSTGITERVTVDSSGNEANRMSLLPSLSDDGNFVVFESDATNLVSNDTNYWRDVFIRDRKQGITERASVDSFGAEGDDMSALATVSGDGSLVGFSSWADNLVTNDDYYWWDVFVHDRVNGVTVRASVDSSGAEGNGHSGFYFNARLSSDGITIAFQSDASNFVNGDLNGCIDVFFHDLCTATASWGNYGAGFPGTTGVPSFTSQQDPVLGTTITVDVSNSYAQPTVGLIFVGHQRASIPTKWGGDLLVLPDFAMPVTFSYGSDSFTGAIAHEFELCGLAIDLQAIELDPGAAKGISFTQGLELFFGQ